MCIVLMFYVLIISSCKQPDNKNEDSKTDVMKTALYVGGEQCQSCHAGEFNDWKKSDHNLAMQHANDSTVLGNFNNATYISDGVTNKFFKKEGKYFINTQGDDGKNHDYEVLFTFGYYPLQQYLISFPGGRMQSTRVSWNTREKKWFHQYAGQKVYHKDWLHWTGNSQNWNTMCASCHSTDLQKNYDAVTDTYKTTWKDINVNCESCHGPGSNHIDFINSEVYKGGERIKNSGLDYAKDTISQLQLNTCAPCHARKADLSQAMIHLGEIMDDMIPQVISDEFYFSDGQIKEEDYEYGSFAQSKMFHNNVRCSSCHNPHSGKLKIEGNNLCLSCHTPKYDTPEHHFHALNTEGAQCINCHMPAKTFMGIDNRRDHSFRVPRPDQSILYETPNTCNSCHKDKTQKWAADAIVKWYGPERKYHFSDDLAPGSLLNDKSESHLVKLLTDTSQPEIARATAVEYLGKIQTQRSADALILALNDLKPLVRYHALRSLENFNADVWKQSAYICLTDKVRAVRIAAADLYHRLPKDDIPLSAKSAYEPADSENKNYLYYQTDFSVGNVMVADYELQDGDYLNAIIHYVRGLKKDSLMNYARLNLAATYNSTGKNQEALKTLKEAATIDPANDRIFYNLGLLYNELGNVPLTLENFQKASRLNSQNPGLYYNYGLALQQQGKLKEAEQILLKGIGLSPQATNINYALAYLYMKQNLPDKARKHAEVLKRNDPQNPDYQVLYQSLGL